MEGRSGVCASLLFVGEVPLKAELMNASFFGLHSPLSSPSSNHLPLRDASIRIYVLF